MKGINSYQDRLKNPGKEIIDFEFVSAHPETKMEIAMKYNSDATFRQELFQKMIVDPGFKFRFYNCFGSYVKETYPRR